MIVFKIFHVPTNQYVQSMGEAYKLQQYVNAAFINLGKKGKNWNTRKGVIDAFTITLDANCKRVKSFKIEDFQIHELTLQITESFKPE